MKEDERFPWMLIDTGERRYTELKEWYCYISVAEGLLHGPMLNRDYGPGTKWAQPPHKFAIYREVKP